jgi:very-short-patch-repair endonuclease
MPALLKARKSEWAIDRYEWGECSAIVLTPIESALWYDICTEHAVLYPQLPVGRFFVDFGNPKARVAIECDGANWHKDKARDASRDAEIAELGWEVIRIRGKDCVKTDALSESGAIDRISEPRSIVRDVCRRFGIRWELAP